MKNLIDRCTWEKSDPANPADIKLLMEKFGDRIPKDYLDFMATCNGCETEIPVNPWWLIVWAAESIIDRWNGYEMEEYIPGFMAFGSNGGDEMYVFHLESNDPNKVYMMPYIGMEPDQAIPVADNFRALIEMTVVSNT